MSEIEIERPGREDRTLLLFYRMLPGCLLVLAATTLITGFNPFRSAPPEP